MGTYVITNNNLTLRSVVQALYTHLIRPGGLVCRQEQTRLGVGRYYYYAS